MLKILLKNKKLKFDNFEDSFKRTYILSVAESLKLIKKNLQNLGIVHDKFISETEIVKINEVEKVIDKLKKKNLVYEGKIKAPKGEDEKLDRKRTTFI